MTIRLLICDDEPLATERLVRQLERCDGVEVIGTATTGEEALDAITRLRPDAALLDVEMPGLDGFDVVEELGRRQAAGVTGEDGEEPAAPLIVFITAYPQFAAGAFDSGAIDFLTKPVRIARLELALERLHRAIEDRSARERLSELSETLDQLRSKVSAGSDESGRLWVSRRGEMLSVALDRLDRISAEGEYVRLYQGDNTYLHRSSIVALLPQLDGRRFLRIHRSHVIRRDQVASILRRPAGGYRIVTSGGETLPVGRTYHEAVHTLLRRA